MPSIRAVVPTLRNNWRWLRWPVALLLLGILFYSNRQHLRQLAARNIDWPNLAIAFALCGSSIVLTFYRWYLLVWSQNFPFRFRDALRLGFIGVLFNYVAPGAAGGDLVKAAMIATEQRSRKGVAAATVLLDRILGMLALVLVGAFASVFQSASLLQHAVVKIYLAVLWGGSLCGVVGLALLLHPAVPRSQWIKKLIALPKVGRMFAELIGAVLLYQTRTSMLVLAVVISMAGHFGMLSSFYFCSRAVQAETAAPGYWEHLLLIPGAEVAAVFVPLPGGVGALEGAVELCYTVANEAGGSPVSTAAAAGAGLATALAYRATMLVVAAIGAGYYLTARSEIGRVLSEQEPDLSLGGPPA